MLKTSLLGCLTLFSVVLHAQNIEGIVVEQTSDSKEIPVMGANVYWSGTTIGTTTNENGTFSIPKKEAYHMLIISYVGYRTDTIHVHGAERIKHFLVSTNELDGVTVTSKQQSLSKSFLETATISKITSKELLKAACCNLSESFATNPSVDVNYSDAITGNKQIKMLGLSSPYILITEENIPSLRGASQTYGLNFVPGTWIESIQITKGAGSVINGYESISGQINTELIKPVNDIPFFLNVYGSADSRVEVNTHFNKKVTDKWSTSLFLHGNSRFQEKDMNHDGFLDNPLGKQINVLNRWQYTNAEKGWVSFLNFRYMKDQKQTGQVGFNPDIHKLKNQVWGAEINSERADMSAKVGYVFPETPYKSFGIQNAYTQHKQQSYYGLRIYDIEQKSFYSNLIYNSIISNTKNKFTTGLNLASDTYDEQFNTVSYDRKDTSVGAFFEYNYDNLENFSAIIGGRIDNHNRLGTFVTPRVHLRYVPWEKSIVRLSGGRGKRMANVFAENQHLMASSRTYMLLSNNPNQPYGLNPEIAWNYGLSFLQDFKLWGKEAQIGIDLFRTDFQNKAIIDVYSSPQAVLLYDLNGKSVANNVQVDFTIDPLTHFSVRTSYKYYDSPTDYLAGTYQTPLQAQHRFFTNLEYKTHIKDKGQHWRFDYTLNWIGQQQLPFTSSNPTAYQLADKSNAFTLMNAQITRSFSSAFELYVGGENLTNYKQNNAVVGADAPFSPYFDASMVYGPVFGAMYYAGLRYKIK